MSNLINSQLSTIATAINEHHRRATEFASSALEHAKQAGDQLIEAKALLPHGGWLSWLAENCEVSPRQAQRYIKVAGNWDKIAKNDTVSYLTFRGVAELLADRTPEPAITTTFQPNGLEYEDFDEEPFVTTSSIDEYEDDGLESVEKKTPHVAHNSGEIEWYTPRIYVEAAAEVFLMAGVDLDPASSKIAQQTVKAGAFYTKDDDGLSKPWFGNVWLNPPYGSGIIEPFIKRLVGDFADGKIAQAVVLTNNATETQWFQLLLSRASAVCFPSGRIEFLDGTGTPANVPLQGQAFCYFGPHANKFTEVFRQFGTVLRTEVMQ
jgi:hypothetical protein